MKKIEKRFSELIHNKEWLNRLMQLEKERLGFDKDKLVFIGMANLSKFYWCPIESFIKSKEREISFFDSYIIDRFLFAKEIGFVKEFPKSDTELLEICSKVTFDNKIKNFNEQEKPKENPFSDGEIKFNTDNEFVKGKIYEMFKAEQYPRIRWNFKTDNYVLIGCPDGIAKDFTYEFKKVRTRFLFNYKKICAFTQADLYSFFFKRKNKRVQIFIEEEKKTETFQEPVDVKRVKETLDKFNNLVDNNVISMFPVKWKCKCCDVKDSCKNIIRNIKCSI